MQQNDEKELRYLKIMSDLYPTIADASTEIINLQSILNLPKGTEHFLTDIHGEYESFLHVLKNGSGAIRRKINDEFANTLSEKDKKSLATLIYYPKEKMDLVIKEESNIDDWYKITLHRLIQMARTTASKYTRSKVRKALPKDFAYVIEELITEKSEIHNKEAYYNQIIETIVRIDRAKEFISALCFLIQRLVVDHIHIVGDVFDRGPGPHIIMDTLMRHHSVDMQWGNHDVVWMGAASGHAACVANVIRLSARYGNLDTLEEGYGINLIPLARFALDTYADDPCSCFDITYNEDDYNIEDLELDRKMHKAISIIQFKLEGQVIKANPSFNMENRLLLDKINFDRGTVIVEGNEYELIECNFPTINPDDPYALSHEEEEVIHRLVTAFTKSEKLQKHVRFLLKKGSLYKVFNGNLLYHGCIPLNADGSFKKVQVFEHEYSGKALYDVLEKYARKGFNYHEDSTERKRGQDIMWFIWSNENSPVYGKAKMATFERYFLTDRGVKVEEKNHYYSLINDEKVVRRIFEEFELDWDTAHIINGHMPVRRAKGETPIHCNGKVLIIDGGFSKAYQSQTGIAGYTLVYNSHGLILASHEAFESTEKAILDESDIHSSSVLLETVPKRQMVSDTDNGKEIANRIAELEKLLDAYRSGAILEH